MRALYSTRSDGVEGGCYSISNMDDLVAVWLVLKLFVSDIVMLGSIVIIAACPPAIICALLGMDYGRDGVEASETIFVGTVLSMFTIPLLVSLLGLSL